MPASGLALDVLLRLHVFLNHVIVVDLDSCGQKARLWAEPETSIEAPLDRAEMCVIAKGKQGLGPIGRRTS